MFLIRLWWPVPKSKKRVVFLNLRHVSNCSRGINRKNTPKPIFNNPRYSILSLNAPDPILQIRQYPISILSGISFIFSFVNRKETHCKVRVKHVIPIELNMFMKMDNGFGR